MTISPSTAQAARQAYVRPIFAVVDNLGGLGGKRVALARRLGISRAQLSHYEHGTNRIPRWFPERACMVVGLPLEVLHTDMPDEVIFQRPNEHRRRLPKRIQESNESGDVLERTREKETHDHSSNSNWPQSFIY